jgi:hypothetical protein
MPSTAAKINFLLGLERTPQDAFLGKIINEGDFKQIFMNLTSRSKSIRRPLLLFTRYSEEQMAAWRDKFKGKQK